MVDDQKQKEDELPDSYTVGEEYFNHSCLISVKFELIFRTSAEILDSTILFEEQEASITNHGDHLMLMLNRDVPEKLFAAWYKGESSAARWVMGYIEPAMLPFNQELQSQRHNFGNPFIRSFSIFDILQIRIVDTERNLGVKVSPPGPVPNFPFFEIPPTEFLERVYMKDFIDAYYAFFSYNFEESLRKVITSLECFFKYHALEYSHSKKPRFPFFNSLLNKRKVRFIKLVQAHIISRCELSQKQVSSELIKAYKIRNSIVHDGQHYTSSDLQKISFDALHFLMDAYKFYEDDVPLNQFASAMESQFLLQRDLIGQGVTMDILRQQNT